MKKTTIRLEPLSFIPRRNSKAQTSYQDIISQTVGGTLVIAIILLLLKNLLLIVYVSIYMRKEVDVEA
jgi:preprotein translocase subunit SecF